MKEDFLHYVWKYQLFKKEDLRSSGNKVIHILKPGIHNRNAGPDFLNAKIVINNQIWVGNVEIHLKSSDWYAHNHENDVNYDATILHVVYEHDVEVYLKGNVVLPTLILKELIASDLLSNYLKLSNVTTNWIPCGEQVTMIDAFLFSNWKERLFFERLERKAVFIGALLAHQNNDFEAVLFQLLAKNFGLKVNGEAFLALSQSIDFSIVRKVRANEHQFMALLFGQAGFLVEDLQEAHHLSLKKEYAYLQHKFALQTLAKQQFSFFRMRPNNFPTIRIAQLVSLYHLHQNLFSKLMQVSKIEDFYSLISVSISSFWQTHYTFDTTSRKSTKQLTKSFIDLLIINTIIPLKFVYEKSRGGVDEVEIISVLSQLKPEKNSIISKFETLKIVSKSAFDTQSLLELKNNYCAPKRCLECAIGNAVLSEK
tara:strand:+ start:11187 stop:12461 length:1275 start_codon:yes stop_codon:yes gene_type:complete